MKTDLNALYKAWAESSLKDKEDAHAKLGTDLYHYLRGIIRQEFPKWQEYLEDGIGEASHEIFKSLDSFDPTKGSFKQWVYGVTVYTCRDLLRKRNKRREIQYYGHEDAVEHPDHEARLTLKKLREGLAPEDNELIDLKLHGATNEEIAIAINTTEDSIKSKWKRLCEELRTHGGGS